MRAAFVLADVLQTEPSALASLGELRDAGISPVILVAHPNTEGARLDAGGFPVVACRPDDADCWGENPSLILDASRRSGATPSEAFMVCLDVEDVRRAAEAACRPVLVLGGRSLDETYGDREPDCKASICATSLQEATRYMLQEAALESTLGPFPYAHVPTLDERARTQAPSRRDLTRVLTATIVAGIAVALGIAYILQEAYRVGTFPSQFYWLTLQFIPQFLRGAIFLAIGVLAALFALFSLNRLPVRFGKRG